VHPVPKRSSLVSQTASLVEQGMRNGRWKHDLPGQHTLCREFRVSRRTLRAALSLLARRDIISISQGRTTQIRIEASKAAPSQLTTAVVLLPGPLWRLRPSVARWVSELTLRLSDARIEVVLSEGGRYFLRHPAPHLEKLVSTHRNALWVLFASTRAMQEWFAERMLPTILVGPAFSGLSLPSFSYDHAAIAQHAATKLATAGHVSTAIFLQHTGSAADTNTCDSFAAARPSGTPPPIVLEHDGSVSGIESQLRRFAALRRRPTGLFITKSLAVPTAFTLLPQLGLLIPRDVSIICREDDAFLEYLVPTVARYGSDSSAMAQKLAVALVKLADGELLKPATDALMPRFIPGKSIARAPE